MIGGSHQHAAQPDEVPREPDIDDLPPTVGQQLVAASPPFLQDEGPLAGLALVHQFRAGSYRSMFGFELAQGGTLTRVEGHEAVQLAGQGALGHGHGRLLGARSRAAMTSGCSSMRDRQYNRRC